MIAKILKKGNKCAERDKKIFEDYVSGNDSLENIKYRFFQSNSVSFEDREKITDEMFVRWLRSIGWRIDETE